MKSKRIFKGKHDELQSRLVSDFIGNTPFVRLSDKIYAQLKATQNDFAKKNIPIRSFNSKKRNEKTLGELFSFFILETILLGRALNINPYNQPAVELIKKETNKILL